MRGPTVAVRIVHLSEINVERDTGVAFDTTWLKLAQFWIDAFCEKFDQNIKKDLLVYKLYRNGSTLMRKRHRCGYTT